MSGANWSVGGEQVTRVLMALVVWLFSPVPQPPSAVHRHGA